MTDEETPELIEGVGPNETVCGVCWLVRNKNLATCSNCDEGDGPVSRLADVFAGRLA